MAEVTRRGGSVLDGAAYEAESSRPYGPWIDALRRVPAVAIGDQLGRELAPLLPELGRAAASPESRDGLFGAVAELLAARAHSAPPVLLAFDDMQWCDAASAELLHYLARMNRHRPVLIALAARDGELQDNEAMQRALRGLRHDGVLEEIAVAPLDAAETAALVGGAAAADVDVERVFAESAGNPLFALEVARSLPHRQDGVPVTLRRLVRDRVERLSGDAADVLRWGAVIGHAFDIDRLAGFCAHRRGATAGGAGSARAPRAPDRRRRAGGRRRALRVLARRRAAGGVRRPLGAAPATDAPTHRAGAAGCAASRTRRRRPISPTTPRSPATPRPPRAPVCGPRSAVCACSPTPRPTRWRAAGRTTRRRCAIPNG